MMKFTAITTTGSYYSPWSPFLLASLYNVVDEIIVVNGGYNLRDPKKDEFNIPLEQVSKDISELDFKGKIVEVKDFTINDLTPEHRFSVMTQKEAENVNMVQRRGSDLKIITGFRNREGKLVGGWFDLRGLNITLANETAVKRGATMILKTDSDQVLYQDCMGLKNESSSLIFYQYEFLGDIFHLSDPPPDSPYNDSCFTYPAHMDDYYGGAGGPAIRGDRMFCERYHCAHLRYANPRGTTHEERFTHFRDRFLFHLYTNVYADFTDELRRDAEATAKSTLERTGTPSPVAPPEVCELQRKELPEYVRSQF